MSKVATAKESELLGSPAPLQEFWRLKIEDSSLNNIGDFQIMSQQSVPNGLSVNRLFGGVDGFDFTNKLTVFSLVDGMTEMAGIDGQIQQLVSFEVMVEGERFRFQNGVLSADGLQINDGTIIKHLNDGTIIKHPFDFEPDGTWSATASGGPPVEKPGKGKGRKQGYHRR
jgi:hypothetical protein